MSFIYLWFQLFCSTNDVVILLIPFCKVLIQHIPTLFVTAPTFIVTVPFFELLFYTDL